MAEINSDLIAEETEALVKELLQQAGKGDAMDGEAIRKRVKEELAKIGSDEAESASPDTP